MKTVPEITILKNLLFNDTLSNYGKHKLIDYYEEKIEKLEKENKELQGKTISKKELKEDILDNLLKDSSGKVVYDHNNCPYIVKLIVEKYFLNSKNNSCLTSEEKLKRENKIMEEYARLLYDILLDYDGYYDEELKTGSIEGLVSLIDTAMDFCKLILTKDDKKKIYGNYNIIWEDLDNEKNEKSF